MAWNNPRGRQPAEDGSDSGNWRPGSTNPLKPLYGSAGAGSEYASGKTAYDAAARAAEEAAARARSFGTTQWDRSQNAMGNAQGAYGPSQDAWTQYYGNASADRGKGEQENWWANNGGKYNDPRATTGVLQQWQQQMGQPMQQTGAYNQYQQYMQQPSSTSGAYSYMQGQLQQPMQGQGAYARNQQAYAKPGTGENWVASNEGQYRNPTNSTTLYNNFMGELGNAGRSEGFQVNQGGQDAYNQKANDLYASQTRAGYLDQNAGEIGSRFRGADDVAQFSDRNMGQLEQTGMFEDWAQSAINGTNPMQDRIREKGLAQLNQEMARRGHFNSGGASSAIGNYLAEQNAQDFAQKSQLAKDAQGLQLQRLGQGQGLAEGSAANKVGIGTSLQGLYNQQDQSKLGRDSLAAQIAKDQAGQDLATQSLSMQANRDADGAKLARLQGLQGMAGQADSSSLSLLNAGTDAAFRSQDAARNRGLDNFNQANQLDQTQLQRLIAQMSGAQQNDQTNADRYKTQFGMAQGVDQSVMDRYGMLGSLAGQEDEGRLGYLNAAGNMAGQTQTQNLNRINSQNDFMGDAFANRFGIDQGIANTYRDFTQMGMNASGQAETNAMNAGTNAAELRAKGEIANSPLQWAKAGGELYKTSQGGGALTQSDPVQAQQQAQMQTADPSMYTSYKQPDQPGAYDQQGSPMQGQQTFDPTSFYAMMDPTGSLGLGGNGGSGISSDQREMLMDLYYQQMGLTNPSQYIGNVRKRYSGGGSV